VDTATNIQSSVDTNINTHTTNKLRLCK
jgi:hypothetical protein